MTSMIKDDCTIWMLVVVIMPPSLLCKKQNYRMKLSKNLVQKGCRIKNMYIMYMYVYLHATITHAVLLPVENTMSL